MINFHQGQAASQASGFNLAAARAISRGSRKDEGPGGGDVIGEKRRAFRSVIAWVAHLRTPTLLFFRSSTPPHPHPSSPPSQPGWTERLSSSSSHSDSLVTQRQRSTMSLSHWFITSRNHLAGFDGCSAHTHTYMHAALSDLLFF